MRPLIQMLSKNLKFLGMLHADRNCHILNKNYCGLFDEIQTFFDIINGFFKYLPQENQLAVINNFIAIKAHYGGFFHSYVDIFIPPPFSCGQLLVMKLCHINRKLVQEERENSSLYDPKKHFELVVWNDYKVFFEHYFTIKPSNIFID